MSPRFYLFVSDVSRGKEWSGWVQYFLRGCKNPRSFVCCQIIVGCGSVWNLQSQAGVW